MESGAKIWCQCGAFGPPVFWAAVRSNSGSVVVGLLFIVAPVVGVCGCSMFCCTLLYVPSSFAIILTGKRELVTSLVCPPCVL